jgi:membrane protein implicated in regulation of membrane protease activity
MRDDMMSRMPAIAISAVLTLFLLPTPALAYIGPGVGAGAIGAVLGVIGSIFLGLFAILWYPIKRVLKRRKKGGDGGAQSGE